MKQESLDKAIISILHVIKDLDIEEQDKLELMTNEYYFLEPEEYHKNVKTLKLSRDKHGQRKRD